MPEKRTPEDARQERTEQEKLEEQKQVKETFRREQLREDIDKLLNSGAGRRWLRFSLGPQVSNLMGPNSEGRIAGVAMADELMEHRPDALAILFATQEEDENGWN
jgi:hypothetical protein